MPLLGLPSCAFVTSADAASGHFTFRLVEAEDLPLLTRWRAAEHVREWWGDPGDLRAEYLLPPEPVHHYVVLLDGAPIGLIEHYHWRDHPDDARVIGASPDEDGIDYFLGERELIGRGHGPAMLSAFLAQVVSAEPGVSGVRLDVSESNRRSWRCLEQIGFTRTRSGVSVAGEPGPHYVYALSLAG